MMDIVLRASAIQQVLNSTTVERKLRVPGTRCPALLQPVSVISEGTQDLSGSRGFLQSKYY